MAGSLIVDRSLVGQPSPLTSAYDDEDLQDTGLRGFTLERHGDQTTLWLCQLNLLAYAFAPGRVYDSGAPEPGSLEDSDEARITRGAYALRFQLLALSGRASKPSLDLTLSGYYTEAWTLIRSMLDGWARCVYVRLRPQEHARWYGADADSRQDGARKVEPSWGEIEGVVRKDGGDDDRALFEEALLRWELLHTGVHPSGEGIEQIRNYDLDVMRFRPDYQADFCMHAFSLGAFVQRAVLREIELMGSHPDWWSKTNAKCAADVESLVKSIQPALDHIAKKRERRCVRSETPRSRLRDATQVAGQPPESARQQGGTKRAAQP